MKIDLRWITTIYHSVEWERYTAMGYVTHTVDVLNGIEIALMIRT